jgi:tripartite-type tricarboxylate transporter receptor subunit TctC
MDKRNVAVATVIALILLASGSFGTAFAQTYPVRPVRVVIGFAPGGSADIVPRVVAVELAKRLGQPWVIDNKPGAGGQIGVAAVLNAPADGYTLLSGALGMIAINPSLYKELAYDPVRDLIPIASVARVPMVILVQRAGPASVRDLIAESKAMPGELNYGNSGIGTAMHLTAEMFKFATGADLTPVAFRTSGEVTAALLGGFVDAICTDANMALTTLRTGKVKAIVVSSQERSPMLPDVPTMAESGYPSFEPMMGWFGFFARAGTPPEIVNKLSAEIERVLQVPEVRERILATGSEPWYLPPAQFGLFVKAEIAKWDRAVRESGAQAK